MTDFNPTDDLRKALESHGPDPRRAAEQWAAQLPDEHVRDALRVLAVKVAPTLVGDTRRSALAQLHKIAPTPEGHGTPEGQRHGAPGRRGRNRWDRDVVLAGLLATEWPVPGRGYKLMSDMTAEDLRLRAGMLRRHAQSTIGQAETCEKLAALIDEHGVSTAGDLPPDALRGLAA